MTAKFRILLLWSLLLALATAGSAWGAELQASLRAQDQTLVLANKVGYDLYVMNLEGGGGTYPVMVRLPAGSQVEISFKDKELPTSLSSATCIFSRPDLLPEKFPYERGGDGLYRLTVQAL